MLWYTYFPSSNKTEHILPEDVELTQKETVSLTDDPRICEAFFYFINRLFFREGRLKPTVENFKKDFGLQSYLFESIFRILCAAFDQVKADSEVALSFDEWTRYLTYTYGSVSTNESLFCKHTYLTTLARFIVWAALTDGENGMEQTSLDLIGSLIRGDYFESKGILNLAEKDFFHWIGKVNVLQRLEGFWLRVLNQLRTYNFDEIDEDLLKGVYQELVDPADRHDLGEYYTPDWLCEKIVDYVIQKSKGHLPSVIDLTCGSGSFIRAAVHRIRSFLSKGAQEHLDWDSVLQQFFLTYMGSISILWR